MRKIALVALFAAIAPLGLPAATLTLKDGTVIHGEFLSSSPRSIVFQDSRGVRRTYNIDQVREIDFRPSSSADREAIVPSPPPPPPSARANSNRDDVRYGREWQVLRPGTEISVRTTSTIDARDAGEGVTYPASIAESVRNESGEVIIPGGSDATLVVRRVREGDTFRSGDLVLDLDSVVVNGRRYVVDTRDVKAGDRSGIGANRRTAEMVGGGAAIGTLLGALAGGGKGAAIGAIAGAVAGGGVQVLTKGKEIKVPAETVLDFRLEEPLRLVEAQ